MANALASPVVRLGPRPVEPETSRETSDQQLLERFVARRDEEAFAELVKRHGGKVWGVCRRVLHQEQDAEDAFQAVFLILARKAGAIRKGEAVGSWLYGVAYRTAMKARQTAVRRLDYEKHAASAMPELSPPNAASCQELQRLLDEEVQRLAPKYRAPFVLCCLEGLSKHEAALELGWKEGTVSGRLARGRKLLQNRLTRRGVTLTSVLTAFALVQNPAVPAALVQATIQAVLAPLAGKAAVAGLSAPVVALANSFLHTLAMAKLKAAVVFSALATTICAGATLTAYHLLPAAANLPAAEDVVINDPEMFQVPPTPFLEQIDEQVLSVAVTPDGKKLVTAGARYTLPGQLKVWDIASGRELVKVRGVKGIRGIAMSPDGKLVATADFAGEVKLRDIETGAQRAAAKGHTIGINSVDFTGDGSQLVTAGLDKVAKLWDVNGLKERQAFRGHTDMIFSVACFHRDQLFVTGGKDNTARIWDIRTGKAKFTLEGHKSAVEVVAVSPDDKIIATGSWDRTIRFWDPATGKQSALLEGHRGSMLGLAFSPDGKFMASAGDDGSIRLWDVKTRKTIGSQGQHDGPAWSLAFTGDSKFLASGSSDKTAKVWEVDTLERPSLLALVGGNSRVKEKATFMTSELRPVNALAYSPDGKTLALATADKTVHIRDAATGAIVRALDGHADAVLCLTVSPDGKLLATAGRDKSVKLWDLSTGAEKLSLESTPGTVYSLAISPDGSKLAGGSDDHIKLWDLGMSATTSALKAALLKDPGGSVQALTFSPDGRTLAAGYFDGTIKLRDPSKDAQPRTLQGHRAAVRALAFARNGILASAAEDGLVKLWDVEGKELRSLQGQATVRTMTMSNEGPRISLGPDTRLSPLWALAFAPGGKTLLSGGLHPGITVWDAVGGIERQRLPGHRDGITALALHPQGTELMSGGLDGSVLRWRAGSSTTAVSAERDRALKALQESRASVPPAGGSPPIAPARATAKETPARDGHGTFLLAGLAIGVVLALSVILLFYFMHKSRALPVLELAEDVQPAPAPAFVSFTCGNCQKHLRVKAEWAGKKVKCPQCGSGVPVPEPSPR
jgi:RNA polymerase sigma factor (sigma-70 family)